MADVFCVDNVSCRRIMSMYCDVELQLYILVCVLSVLLDTADNRGIFVKEN
jgi:hypothetical protein